MGSTIHRVLEDSNYSELELDDMTIQCLRFMNRALQVVSRHGSNFKHDATFNRTLFIEVFPLQLLFERSLTADNIELNLPALETLGQLCEGEDDQVMLMLEQVEMPWATIIINFLKPYINTMGQEEEEKCD